MRCLHLALVLIAIMGKKGKTTQIWVNFFCDILNSAYIELKVWVDLSVRAEMIRSELAVKIVHKSRPGRRSVRVFEKAH